MHDYKVKYAFDDRLQVSGKILERYSDRVPVICEPRDREKLKLDKTKFLCPRDYKMGHFVLTLRRRLQQEVNSSDAIYIFSNGQILPNSMTMGEIYEKHKDSDGLLYFVFDKESTFG